MPETKIKTTTVAQNAFLHYIGDQRHKTNYTSLYFTLPLSKENATRASLLARVLRRGSADYPDMSHLNSALDENYATSLSFSTAKQGDRLVFALSLSTMKDEFAPNGEKIFKTALDIAFSVLKRPLLENSLFKKEYFDTEKINLADAIRAQINNKASYSRQRFISHMCKGEPYAVNAEGDLDTLASVTREELLAFLDTLLHSARCDVFFVGSVDFDKLCELITSRFGDLDRKGAPLECACQNKPSKPEPSCIDEELDVNQCHLWIGFRAPARFDSDSYLKFALFNMVLGGDVSSKLFMNLREKMSLCYTCYSAFDGSKGLLYAYAGIDKTNYEKAKNAFFEELEKVREGKITPTELQDAKNAFINRMHEISDNPSLLSAWFFPRLDTPREPYLDACEIEKLTVDDVVWASKQIELDTIYFLKGER